MPLSLGQSLSGTEWAWFLPKDLGIGIGTVEVVER
jgi:hypothetical protein